jgi:hypothetical protein
LGSFNGGLNTIDDPSWLPFQDLLACGVRKIPIKARISIGLFLDDMG